MYLNEKKKLLDFLRENLSYNFDILDNHKFYEYGFDIVAKATLENYRTVFNMIKVDKFFSYEFNLVKILDSYDIEAIKEFIEITKNNYKELFKPSQDIMGTISTLLFIVPEVKSQDLNFIINFRYVRSFMLGLKGKYEIRIIFFDIKNKKVYTNKNAKVLRVYYEKLFKKGVVDGDMRGQV